MMKKCNKTVILIAVVLGLVGVGMYWLGKHRTTCQDHHHGSTMVGLVPQNGEMPGHPTPQSMSVRPDIQLDDDQKRMLLSVFHDINEAYTNCQVDVLRTRIAQVPDWLYQVSQSTFLELNALLYAEVVFPHCCLNKGKQPLLTVIEYDDEKKLEDYVHVCFEAARFVGGFSVRRGVYSNSLGAIEPRLLVCLLALKKHFREIGRKKLEDKIDALIAEWHEQIESPKGLTRQFALHQVDLYLFMRRRHPEKCWLSNEAILKIGRAHVDPLIRIGYVPKWLDEEFPNAVVSQDGKSDR